MTYVIEVCSRLTGSVLERYSGMDTYNEADAKRIALENENDTKCEEYPGLGYGLLKVSILEEN